MIYISQKKRSLSQQPKCETEEDPHSPQTRELRTVLWQGAELYRQEASNEETL
jgi:stearoyl-CoA desaturase (delta-9 desaturase)